MAPSVCPALELGDENVVRHRYRRPSLTRIPTPEHQFVVADMLDQRGEIAVTVAGTVLDHCAQLVGRQTDPGHFVRGWRQAPVRRPWRCVSAVTGWRITLGVAGSAGQTRRTLAVHAPHDVHCVSNPGVELQRRIAGDMAVLAARALKDLLHGIERLDGLLIISEQVLGVADQADQHHRAKNQMSSHLTPPTVAVAVPASVGRSGRTPRWPLPAPWAAHRPRRCRRVCRCWARYALPLPAFR